MTKIVLEIHPGLGFHRLENTVFNQPATTGITDEQRGVLRRDSMTANPFSHDLLPPLFGAALTLDYPHHKVRLLTIQRLLGEATISERTAIFGIAFRGGRRSRRLMPTSFGATTARRIGIDSLLALSRSVS